MKSTWIKSAVSSLATDIRLESFFEFQSDGCVAHVVELVGSTPHLDVNAAVHYNNIEAIS